MEDFQNDIEQCLQVLKKGGLILYPTDTVWGIGCDATNDSAVQKVYALKKRPDEKAMIVLVAGERDILQYVAAPDPHVFDYVETIPRPVTVIYDGAIGLAGNLVGKDGSIAIRICKDPFCRQLLQRFKKPIVSTSANLSGMPVAATFREIDPEIAAGVDYVVHHRRGQTEKSVPSMVIRWADGVPVVLRS